MKKIIIILSFIIILSALFILYNPDFRFHKSSYPHNEFNYHNISFQSLSLFNKTLSDGFDKPFLLNNSLRNIRITNSKLINFNDFDVKHKLGFPLTGVEYFSDIPSEMKVYVSTLSKGKVIYSAYCEKLCGFIVMIQHNYYENGEIKTIVSEYYPLQQVVVSKGDYVERFQGIGTFLKSSSVRSLHLELRKQSILTCPPLFQPDINNNTLSWIKENYEAPSAFINEHQHISLPAEKALLIVINKKEYKLHIYNYGKQIKSYDIALSQEPGKKLNEGDNRTPEGEYKICQMFKGPFTEKDANGSGLFLGSRWIGISYPNKYDAVNAKKKGLINSSEFDSVVSPLRYNEMPYKNTYLGGGIGIHGWNGEWPINLKDITWGCISMKQKDLEELFNQVYIGTSVIIQP